MVHRKHRRMSRRSKKNMIRKTLTTSVEKGVDVVKNTSKKYMPKVKTGLEDVGSKVTSTAKKSVPMLQQATRKFFGLFGLGKGKGKGKTKKRR